MLLVFTSPPSPAWTTTMVRMITQATATTNEPLRAKTQEQFFFFPFEDIPSLPYTTLRRRLRRTQHVSYRGSHESIRQRKEKLYPHMLYLLAHTSHKTYPHIPQKLLLLLLLSCFSSLLGLLGRNDLVSFSPTRVMDEPRKEQKQPISSFSSSSSSSLSWSSRRQKGKDIGWTGGQAGRQAGRHIRSED